MSRAAAELGGVRASPNIWEHPETYERENLAFDRAHRIEETIGALHPYAEAHLLDIGCGTGFHLPEFVSRGARVIGVEPHPPLARLAAERLAARRVAAAVLIGAAQAMPLPDRSIDIVHARWAYFFGPGCEPGLREVARVLRPGGVAVIVDNDATTSTFGGWFARFHPAYDSLAVERFWRRAGFERHRLELAWECASRTELEALVRIEFTPAAADVILAEHSGTSVDYAVNLWWRRR